MYFKQMYGIYYSIWWVGVNGAVNYVVQEQKDLVTVLSVGINYVPAYLYEIRNTTYSTAIYESYEVQNICTTRFQFFFRQSPLFWAGSRAVRECITEVRRPKDLNFYATFRVHKMFYDDKSIFRDVILCHCEEKRVQIKVCRSLHGYRDTADWLSRPNSVRFFFMWLDVEQSSKKKDGYMRRIAGSHFGCCCSIK